MVDIRKEAIKFTEKLEDNGILQIPYTPLKLACREFLQTTDRGIIPLFIEYLEETGIIEQVSNGKQPVYKLDYEQKNQLKQSGLSWLLTKAKKQETSAENPIEKSEAVSNNQ